MDLKLRNAAVLITGASRGLGREFALAFADEGARVAICARDATKLEETAAAVRARGAECLALTADLTDGAACQRVVDETAARFGRLDVLVNNASASVDRTPRSIEAATDGEVMARLQGKTLVAIRCARAALPHMRKGGGGRIVNIAAPRGAPCSAPAKCRATDRDCAGARQFGAGELHEVPAEEGAARPDHRQHRASAHHALEPPRRSRGVDGQEARRERGGDRAADGANGSRSGASSSRAT
jgi:NAD(P)-dependent dehydrogenase (short-subunit alcohol dehydrogenase family)